MMNVIILIITIILMMMNKTWSIILCSNWASKPGPEGSEGSEGAPRATARRPSQLWSHWAWWHFWSQWEQWDHDYEAVAGNDDGFDEILNFLWWILLVAKQKIVRRLIFHSWSICWIFYKGFRWSTTKWMIWIYSVFGIFPYRGGSWRTVLIATTALISLLSSRLSCRPTALVQYTVS